MSQPDKAVLLSFLSTSHVPTLCSFRSLDLSPGSLSHQSNPSSLTASVNTSPSWNLQAKLTSTTTSTHQSSPKLSSATAVIFQDGTYRPGLLSLTTGFVRGLASLQQFYPVLRLGLVSRGISRPQSNWQENVTSSVPLSISLRLRDTASSPASLTLSKTSERCLKRDRLSSRRARSRWYHPPHCLGLYREPEIRRPPVFISDLGCSQCSQCHGLHPPNTRDWLNASISISSSASIRLSARDWAHGDRSHNFQHPPAPRSRLQDHPFARRRYAALPDQPCCGPDTALPSEHQHWSLKGRDTGTSTSILLRHCVVEQSDASQGLVCFAGP